MESPANGHYLPVADIVNQIRPPLRLGILATLPSHKTDYTSEDASWWAAQLASIAERDSHLEQMAQEAEAVDRLVAGCCL